MNKSDEIKDLAAALAKAQGAITDALRDSENPFFKSKYADLASVWEACRKPLSANGLSVLQAVSSENGEYALETVLLHSSGQFMGNTIKLMLKDATMQGIGSAITYARRYQLAAFVGVAPDDDDDGNAASGKTEKQVSSQPAVDKTKHWCEKHQTNWFIRGNMKAYSHPVNDATGKTLTWCSEPKAKPEAAIFPEPATPQDAPETSGTPPTLPTTHPEPSKPSVASVVAQGKGEDEVAWVTEALNIVKWQPATLVSWVNQNILTPNNQPALSKGVGVAQVVQALNVDQKQKLTDHLNAMVEAS